MNHSMTGFPVLYYLPKFAQTHAHWFGDVTQPSHSLSSPSPPAFHLFQHQGLFQWVGSLHQVTKILELQHQSLNIQGWFPLGLGLISLQSKGLSRVFLSTIIQKHQFFKCSAFFMVQLSHPYMTTGKTIALALYTFVSKVTSLLFNTLSQFVIAFLPRSKHPLISWWQSSSMVFY